MLSEILNCYGQLFEKVDEWFTGCQICYAADIQCRSGCNGCCRGLFDITLLDACYLQYGFSKLPLSIRKGVLSKAELILFKLNTSRLRLAPPFFINNYCEDILHELMPDNDMTPCLLLDPSGQCLLYDYRPMTCRLHGIPLIDISGETFHDSVCTMNFINSNQQYPNGIYWDFRQLFTDEKLLFHQLTTKLIGKKYDELDTLIPLALLIDYISYDWSELVQKLTAPSIE